MRNISIHKISFITLVLCFFLGVNNSLKGQSEPDAIIEKQIKEYTLNKNGSMEYHQFKRVKLLTYNAMHRLYGETFIIYNPNYQKLKLLDCYTIMKDGSKVKTPSNAFNEVLPRFAANAPAYNILKEMVVTHTGLEIGSTTVLDYQLSSTKDFSPGLMASEVLTETSPVKDMDIIVRIPKDIYLYFDIFNLEVNPSTNEDGEFKVYKWHFKDLPMHLNEPNQPSALDFLPTLIFSTIAGHEKLSSWFTGQNAFKMDCNEPMKEFARKIQKEEKDDFETALKLQESIVNDFLYYGVPASFAAYRARPAVEVWSGGGGTALEKTLLLSSLLKSLNIKAEPLAVVPESYLMSFANPALWEDYVVQVQLKGQLPVYLSVHELNDRNLRTKVQNKQYLPLPQIDKFVESKDVVAQNLASLTTSLILNEKNSVTGSLSVELSGACIPDLGIARSTHNAEFYIGGTFGAKFKDVKINDQSSTLCEISISLDKDNNLKKEGDYLFLGLPFPEGGLSSWHLGELPILRESPFEIPFPVQEEINLTIELPKHVELISPLTDKQIDNVAGSFSIKIVKSGDKITLKKVITLNNKFNNPAYYPAMRELVNTSSSKLYKELIFKIK